MTKEIPYVVWNGERESLYIEDETRHDCMVLADDPLISVQLLRKYMIQKGLLPVIVFSCESGTEAHEVDVSGQCFGVFSLCWAQVAQENPHSTFRDRVTSVNEAMQKRGVEQKCEIVCRQDVLDHRLGSDSTFGKALSVMIFDMCRVPEET